MHHHLRLGLWLWLATARAAWPFSSSTKEEVSQDVLVSPISNREVRVSVAAPTWPSTPHNVLCEAWAIAQPHWQFLDTLADILETSDEDMLGSYQDATELALQAASGGTCNAEGDCGNAILPPELLQYALTMRAQSPTCELHRGLAEEVSGSDENSDAFAVVYPSGEVASSVEDVSGLVDTCAPDSSANFDDILLPDESPRVPLGTPPLLVVLYANLVTSSFVSFYRKLVELKVPFVVRHKGSSSTDSESVSSRGTVLQGFGARLDIRNVEYKVFDDRGDSDDANAKSKLINATGMETMINQAFAGVNLTALGVDDTTLQATLWAQHEAQGQHQQLLPPTWQRRQLSLQAAYVVSQSGQTGSTSMGDPLVTLEEVSQNLPSVASTLVHVKVPDEFTETVEKSERMLQEMMRSNGGGLWINGKTVAIQRPSFNVFELIKLLQTENAELFKLRDTLLPFFADLEDGGNAAMNDVQRAWMLGDDFSSDSDDSDDDDDDDDDDEGDEAPSEDTSVRINVAKGSDGAVMYLNDIEKDADYAQWPTSVKQMLMSMQYGMPPAVRRNIFTLLGIVDPTKPDKPIALDLASQLVQSQYPARLGLLIAGDSDVKACTEWILSTKPAEGEPCPMDTPLFENTEVESVEDLKSITATARVYHRLVSLIANEYKQNSRIVMAYGEYMTSSIYQQVEGRGKPLAVFGLLTIHNQLLTGMQIVSRAPPLLDTFNKLVRMEEMEQAGKRKPKWTYGKAVRFAADKGLEGGMSFVNGLPMPASNDDGVQEKMGQMFMKEQNHIFGLIMKEEITDTEPASVYEKLLSGDNVFPKIHPLLSSAEGPESFVSLDHGFGATSLLDTSTDSKSGIEDFDAIFIIEAVADLETAEGLAFASNFVERMESISLTVNGASVAAKYRILPSSKGAASMSLCAVLAHARLVGLDTVKKILGEKSSQADADDILASIRDHDEFDGSKCSGAVYFDDIDPPTSNYIIANGRVYYPEVPEIAPTDIELLMSLVIGRTKAVTNMMKEHIISSPLLFDAVASTCAFLSISNSNTESYRGTPEADVLDIEFQLDLAGKNPLRFEWNKGQNDGAMKLDVFAMIDPATETAQRASSLLRVIRDQLKLPLTLILAPRSVLDGDAKIPISSYYRFVTDPTAYQDDFMPPTALFSNLPINHILTLRMDVPEPWNIQQIKSVQDTDNLRCDIQSGCSDAEHDGEGGDRPVGSAHVTQVEYGLVNLLFFGQCYQARGSPPNGLQLTLSKGEEVDSGDSKDEQVEISADGSIVSSSSGQEATEVSHFSDTVVMKTVGYWQLQARPGVWTLGIDKNSRGSEIFDMVDGTVSRGAIRVKEANVTFPTKRLVMKDFVSESELLIVKRRSGFEKASLFYDDEDSSVASTDGDDTIHVFSLATGHLYERFLKIMMLSVTKRTSSKVKFWLFENFLSPSFKSSAIAMAKRIGCDVGFVTYKWPEWLRNQKEKQRIIWGYKILFLDVLFPLNVKKIIYVDADQVVRGDLKELWDMDLQGAPYGYTPFCTSRETTLGFQFWNKGFWETHLRGKPYHISALYVVDLDQFRKTLVGDQLRSIYHSLSADPNSLANLDQDLPNYAQHQVPIFSLPQEWLWCETWCSDETKATSKTIDLCNNPLHKEPKVSMAKRIISGELFPESWVELDQEVEKYEKEFLATMGEAVSAES